MRARDGLALVFLVLCACGSSGVSKDSSSALATVRSYQVALQAGDKEAVLARLHPLRREHGEPPFLSLFDDAREQGAEIGFELGRVVIDDQRAEVGFKFPEGLPLQHMDRSVAHVGVFRLYRGRLAGGAFGPWAIQHVEWAPIGSHSAWPGDVIIDVPRVSSGWVDRVHRGHPKFPRVYVTGDGVVRFQDGVAIASGVLAESLRRAELPKYVTKDGQLAPRKVDKSTRRLKIIRVHADRATPWSAVRDLLRLTAKTWTHLDGVAFATRGPWPRPSTQRLEVMIGNPQQADEGEDEQEDMPFPDDTLVIPLELARQAHGVGATRHTVIRLSDGSEVVLPENRWPRSPAEVLERSRAYARALKPLSAKIRTAIRKWGALASEARLEIRFADPLDPSLPYCDVVQMIDALTGSGVVEVVLLGILPQD